MLVKVKLTSGRRQIFHTNEYLIAPIKDMHPDILEAKVYTDDGRKKLACVKRPHQKRYEKYEYKPLPPAAEEPAAKPEA